MNTKTIYFDEAGFTGSNMLSSDQPAFVYASVAIDPPNASHILTEMTTRFHLQGKELKGMNLIGHRRGQQAISWLLNECKGISCIAVSNKKFALAGKFFEHIFEPVLAPINSIFYALEFHLFIANLLYVLFESKDEHAEDIMDEFQALMRTQDPSRLKQLLTPIDRGIKLGDPLGQILTFVVCHKNRIVEEINRLSEVDGLKNWVLELTTTSLFWLLSFWGERFDSIEVCCDKSKPLEINRKLFDALIGRQDRIYMKLGNKPEVLLTYNLAGPVILVDSIQSPGVQIADILASSIAYGFKNPNDSLSKEWLSLADSMFSSTCILPALEALNLHERKPFINALVLRELVERTLKGRSLLVDWDKFLLAAVRTYEYSLLKGG